MATLAVRGAVIANQLAKSRATGQQIKASAPPGSIESAKTAVTATAAIGFGFVPINPFLWVFQIPLFILFILMFSFLFGMPFGHAFLGAYFFQAIITAFIYYKFLNIASTVVLGI